MRNRNRKTIKRKYSEPNNYYFFNIILESILAVIIFFIIFSASSTNIINSSTKNYIQQQISKSIPLNEYFQTVQETVLNLNNRLK